MTLLLTKDWKYVFLRHAGVYTPEEVVMLTRDKLIKLQALYVDQFKRLHHQLKEARRRYLHGSKKEKENGGMSTAQILLPYNSSRERIYNFQLYQIILNQLLST